MIHVRVSATSANVGVGYDCLGLALTCYCDVYFEQIETGLQISGCDEMYCNENNLFYRSFCKACEYMKQPVCGLRIKINSEVPFARGMGSSATCIVAGICAASKMYGDVMDKNEIFNLATQMEGHPDNVAPAIFGGLCVSFMDKNEANVIRFGVKSNIRFITIIPDYEVSTSQARTILPTTMSYEKAIYQMGRCTALAKAFEIGNMLILQKACNDQMHEPYRKLLIPQFDEVKKICLNMGATTFFISGSGSTMMAVSDDLQCVNNIQQQLKKCYPTWEVKILQSTYEGVLCEVI